MIFCDSFLNGRKVNVKMKWLCLNIYTTHEGIEPLSAALMDIGISGIVINDPYDIDQFVANKTDEWDYIDDDLADTSDKDTYITVYITNDADGAELLSEINTALMRLKAFDEAKAYGNLNIENTSIREEDWENNWKRFFKPVYIGEKLVIKPTWEDLPSDNTRVVIELDPESSFGTGRHYTTQLCLELLEKYIHSGDKVADLGCGSGIISIAAMMLGAESAKCTDIAENAIRIAKDNALKNGIADDKYAVYFGDIAADNTLAEKFGVGYDLVAANIVADVLLSMTDVFKIITRNGGILVISGIIDDRLDEVMTKITDNGFEVIEAAHRDIWNAAALRRV